MGVVSPFAFAADLVMIARKQPGHLTLEESFELCQKLAKLVAERDNAIKHKTIDGIADALGVM